MIKKVNILGLTYTVEEVDVVNKHEPRQGEVAYYEQTIRIDRTLSEERKDITLWHEIIHAICEQLGYNDIGDNETFVQGMALGLHQAINGGAIYGTE